MISFGGSTRIRGLTSTQGKKIKIKHDLERLEPWELQVNLGNSTSSPTQRTGNTYKNKGVGYQSRGLTAVRWVYVLCCLVITFL